MKEKWNWAWPGILCAGAALSVMMGPVWMAWPMVTLGRGLRALSLSGGVGNLIAIVLFWGAGLWPLALKWKKPWVREDGWLVAGCAMGLMGLYVTINPGLRPMVMNNAVGDAAYAGTVYGLLLAWDVSRAAKRARTMESRGMYTFLALFLDFCALGLLIGTGLEAVAAGAELVGLLGQSGLGGSPWADGVMILWKLGMNGAVNLTLAGAMHQGSKLVKGLEKAPYGAQTVEDCRALERQCGKALGVTVAAAALGNTVQVLMAGMLTNVTVGLSFPLTNVAVLFAGLALTRLLEQGKELKDDNDLFV